jgi:hypothetical protein
VRKPKPQFETAPAKSQHVRPQTTTPRTGAQAKNGADGPTPVRANVILQHSEDAARVRRLALAMLQEVETYSRPPAPLQDLSLGIDAMAAGGKVPPGLLSLAQVALGEALTIESRAGILKNLSESLSDLAAIEHGVADSIRNLVFQHLDRLMGLQIGLNASHLPQTPVQRSFRH